MIDKYLDYSATSPPSPSVQRGLRYELLENWFNASSTYAAGRSNKEQIEIVRRSIAKEINCDPEEIVFTSGGSEANALAIDGYKKSQLKKGNSVKVACSAIEHSSIMENSNINEVLMVDSDGLLIKEAVERSDSNLFSVMMVNNEIGVCQPIKEIADHVHSKGALLHVDCVQAFGKYKIDVKYLGIDMASFSGHKIGSLKGVGFLYVRKGIELEPIIYGMQEQGLRGGTYNDFAIKSLGLAIEDIDYNKETVIRSRRDFLMKKIKEEIPNVRINGSLLSRNSSNINITFNKLNVTGEQLVGLLNEQGWMISQGSACHSGMATPSHVLKAIGLSDEEAVHTIRITLGIDNVVQDLEDFVDALKFVVNQFKDEKEEV